MASVYAGGQNRVALFRQAEKRRHFTAWIQKYEAKVRHEIKGRALLREQIASSSSKKEQDATTNDSARVPQKDLPEESEVQTEKYPRVVTVSCRELEPVEEVKSFDLTLSVVQKGLQPEQKVAMVEMEPKKSSEAFRVSWQKPANEAKSFHLNSSPTGKVSTFDLNSNYPSVAEPHLLITHAPKPGRVIELNVVAVAADLKIRIKSADMAGPLQEHAFRRARDILDSLNKVNFKPVAYTLKKEFDQVYGPAWHCIVGTSFGSYVTHSLGGFVYFSLDKISILLFKTAVEPLEQ